MNEVFYVLAPVFVLGLIGYSATRFRFFTSSHRDGLSKYVFDFAVPILLFSTVVELDPPVVSATALFASYYIPLSAIFVLGLLISWLLLKRPVIESMVIGLGSCHSNAVLLGIPIIPRALGDEAFFPLFLLISVHGITIFTAFTLVIEITKGRNAGFANLPRQVLTGLIGNPLIVGLGVGFLWKLTGLGIHPIAADVFDLVTTSVTPAALFVLGSSLASYSVSSSVTVALSVTILKNAIHPLAVFLFGSWLGLEMLWLSVATILAAMPTGINMYLFARRYQVSPPTATTSIFISTVSSVVTVSIVITLLKSI